MVGKPKRVVVLSLKGGVGKSTIAALLAKGLQQRNHHVGLLDLDVHGPTAPYALGLDHAPKLGLSTGNETIIPVDVNGIKLVSLASHFGEGWRITWQGQEKFNLVQEMLSQIIDWGEGIDYIVVDSPPSQGEEVQAILSKLPELHGVILVTQPSDFSTADSLRVLDLFREVGVPLYGVIANMTRAICPHCGRTFLPLSTRYVDITTFCAEQKVRFLMDIPFLGEKLDSVALNLADVILSTVPEPLPAGKVRRRMQRQIARRVLEKL